MFLYLSDLTSANLNTREAFTSYKPVIRFLVKREWQISQNGVAHA